MHSVMRWADVNSARVTAMSVIDVANTERIFLRLGSDIGRSDAVSDDRIKTHIPRTADDTAPILVPDGAGIWT
jgi:hypothetical protein